MTRRSSLPGAAELFRPTAEPAVEAVVAAAEPPRPSHLTPVPAGRDLRLAAPLAPDEATGPLTVSQTATREPAVRRTAPRTVGDRQPSGRERHDEKITVYVSPGELVDLEQARLTLRAEHGLAVDRGRIVREALAVVLADLDSNGPASTLVRRLTGS